MKDRGNQRVIMAVPVDLTRRIREEAVDDRENCGIAAMVALAAFAALILLKASVFGQSICAIGFIIACGCVLRHHLQIKRLDEKIRKAEGE